MFFYNTMLRYHRRKYMRIHPKGCSCHDCQEKITKRHYNMIKATVGGIIIMALFI